MHEFCRTAERADMADCSLTTGRRKGSVANIAVAPKESFGRTVRHVLDQDGGDSFLAASRSLATSRLAHPVDLIRMGDERGSRK